MANFKPTYIVIEGVDGSGKSTQAAALAKRLAATLGREVVLVQEPGSTKLGTLLRKVLLRQTEEAQQAPMTNFAELLMFTAARTQLMEEIVVPALKRNAIVVSDRGLGSTLAYQHGGSGLPLEAVMQAASAALYKHVNSLIPEDMEVLELMVVYDVTVDVAKTRMVGRRLDYWENQPSDYKERVAAVYRKLPEILGEDDVRVLDASGTAEQVADATWALVMEAIERNG